MLPTYEDVLKGLHERFATVSVVVDGETVTFEEGRNMQLGEPSTVHTFPFLYSMSDSWIDETAGQVVAHRYTTLHRVVFKFLPGTKTGAQTERALAALQSAIPAAVRSDPRLGSRLTRGIAKIPRSSSGFDFIGDTLFRVIDFYSDVLVK